jgi:hypothetical protein
MMEVIRSFEMLVRSRATRRNIPEGDILLRELLVTNANAQAETEIELYQIQVQSLTAKLTASAPHLRHPEMFEVSLA